MNRPARCGPTPVFSGATIDPLRAFKHGDRLHFLRSNLNLVYHMPGLVPAAGRAVTGGVACGVAGIGDGGAIVLVAPKVISGDCH